MPEIYLEIQGAEAIQRKAEKIADEIARSGKLVARAVMVLERQMKINASGRPGPRVQTGRLRASILPEIINSTLGRIGPNVFYAKYVEFGHMQHPGQFVPPLRKRLVASHAPAYPFVQPAIEQTKGQLDYVNVQFGAELAADWGR